MASEFDIVSEKFWALRSVCFLLQLLLLKGSIFTDIFTL